MLYTVETRLVDFKAWDGGKYVLDHLTVEQIEVVDAMLTEYWFGIDFTPSETQLNDALWFERDTLAGWFGFETWEELEEANASKSELEFDRFGIYYLDR